MLLGVLALSGCDLLDFGGELSYEDAEKKLQSMVDDIDWEERFVQQRAKLSLDKTTSLTDTLPEIGRFPISVQAPRGGAGVVVEIFASTEKSGSDTDGWLNEVAQAFNQANVRLDNGGTARVTVRKIASGTGYEYIASGKYRPQGFTPSNHLWGQMVEAHGIKMEVIADRLVGNIAGVVMKSDAVERMRKDYGGAEVPNLIDAVVQGNLVMGYTNPFASSTGLNFLVTVLARFSNDEPQRMLDPDVVSAFESFQRGVPFVALTTLQMRDSVQNEGSLDAFVMEYQTFVKTPVLQSGYDFIPFGFRHDNPLYAVGELKPEELETLRRFAEFSRQPRFARLARDYGFDPQLQHQSSYKLPSGRLLVQAQKLWKEKKDAGRPIAALFLADVSGSMGGGRIRALKKALLDGSEFISPGNSIGLATFSDRVRVLLPIKPFNLPHKAAFHAAVGSMDAGGNTAMYDGIAVALNLLAQEKRKNPDVKPILFVLSDGKTNRGHVYEDMERVVRGINIPVYTIGYAAKLDELQRVSGLVEAANINADEGEISYKIGSMLNAQM